MTREEILKIAKPILFNTEMVRAILDGRKTTTRRLIKPQPPTGAIVEYNENKGIYWSWWMDGDKHFAPKDGIKKPPYKPGQYLYVRETWKYYEKRVGKGENCYLQRFIAYRADEERNIKKSSEWYEGKWHPSIHIPKEAARIWLFCEQVAVEQLREITDNEALREGFSNKKDFLDTFYKLYPEINEETWVWKISFKKIQKPT